jgi:hypothetical protein
MMGEDASPEASGEGRWVTYDELGRIRGIGPESAVKLAQRKRWRRIPGNDGVARVCVPLDWLTPAKEPSGEHSPKSSPELMAALAALTDQLLRERSRADAAEARADMAVLRAAELREAIAVLEARLAEGALAEARAHAERAETSRDTDRARAEALRQMLDEAEAAEKRARAHAETAEDYVEALRQTEEARRGRGALARLRAAWRGE